MPAVPVATPERMKTFLRPSKEELKEWMEEGWRMKKSRDPILHNTIRQRMCITSDIRHWLFPGELHTINGWSKFPYETETLIKAGHPRLLPVEEYPPLVKPDDAY